MLRSNWSMTKRILPPNGRIPVFIVVGEEFLFTAFHGEKFIFIFYLWRPHLHKNDTQTVTPKLLNRSERNGEWPKTPSSPPAVKLRTGFRVRLKSRGVPGG